MSPTENTIDPYRFLFPLGYVLGVLGTALWIFFYSGGDIGYPGTLHASTMMSGFQFCIAAGFLMTAIPRFTGTDSANRAELWIAFGLGLTLLLSLLIAAFRPEVIAVQDAFWVALTFSVFVVLFFLRRFIQRTHSPPPSFSFVAVALLFSVAGNLILALSSFLPVKVVNLGRLVLYHGMMLGLVLGVGSRLITANLGWMQNPIMQISLKTRKKRPLEFLRSSYGVSWFWTIFFVLSFFIEVFGSVQIGRILRALIASIVILPTWKLYRLPRVATKMATWLWISSWFVFSGLWIYALIPGWAISGAHFMFIGGFSLMIFLIASRVTLSHGGHDLSMESRSRVYALVGALTAVAALLRFVVSVAPNWTAELILSAAWVLLLALVTWAYAFLGKVLRVAK